MKGWHKFPSRNGALTLGRSAWLLAAVTVFAVLAGCAAQSAHRQGNALIAEGKVLDGLAKLEEASRLEPRSTEYRLAYLRARDLQAIALLERADTERERGSAEEAERLYRDVLAAGAQQDRALAGLRMLDRQRRWDAAIKEAEQALSRKDPEGARAKLKSILAEEPRHAAAEKMMRRVEEASVKPSGATELARAYKQPITLEFRDVPLRTVFEVLSRTSRLNFLFDKEVKTDQRTSIYLRNSTVEAAVNWLLLTNQLEQRVLDGSSVLVYPATAAKQREYQPLSVRSFYLANAEAKNVANTLKTLLKSKDVVVDEKLNLVILRDGPEAIRLAEKLVALHDVAEPEVMLEVEILEVKRGRLLDLGVRWPDQVTLSMLPSATGGTLTLEDFRNPTRRSVGVTAGSTVISARKQDSDTNILANPRIRARNHEKAKILIGERVPNITTTSTATGFVAESVNYVDVGLKLEVEPTIYLDNEVAIKISLEVSSIISQQQTKAGSLAYQLGTRTAQTVLRLKDGENQVLAGLINDEDRRSANKIPALGELPLLGRLFGAQSDDSSKTEIVLSITPRIVRNVQRPDAGMLEFDSGTEASVRGWPSDAGITPAGPVNQAGGSATGVPTGPSAGPAAGPTPGPAPAGATGGAPAGAVPPLSSAAPPPASVVSTTSGGVPGLSQLRWEGASQVRAGETFMLQVAMQTDQPVHTVPIVLGFDPKVLQVMSVMEGSFLKEGGAATTFSHRVDANGQVLLSSSRVAKASGASSPAAIAVLSLRALPGTAAGETRVQVLSASPIGVSGQAVQVDVPGAHVLTVMP